LRRFQERGYHATELYFLIGADAFSDITSWREYPHILDRAHFTVVSRPGRPVHELPARLPSLAARMVDGTQRITGLSKPSIILIDRPTADVSSTAIRARLARGESIDGMVDPRVQQHIQQHGLYLSRTPDRRSVGTPTESTAGRLHGQS
jgi:nicotinate-nucleotide adenylyltransferase